MAIAHFSASIVSRGDGRSAVLSAAYRHCAKMEYEREARTIDYTRKQGLLHEEFVLPANAPKWARALIADRSVAGAAEAFWNTVEAFEKRSDAQLARDLTELPSADLARRLIEGVPDEPGPLAGAALAGSRRAGKPDGRCANSHSRVSGSGPSGSRPSTGSSCRPP